MRRTVVPLKSTTEKRLAAFGGARHHGSGAPDGSKSGSGPSTTARPPRSASAAGGGSVQAPSARTAATARVARTLFLPRVRILDVIGPVPGRRAPPQQPPGAVRKASG